MKQISLRSIYVSLTSLALVFALGGCTRQSVEPKSASMENSTSTGQAQVREMAETGKARMDQMATQSKAKLEQLAESGENQLNEMAAASDSAVEKITMQGVGYNEQEKQQFLGGCQKSCAQEGPKSTQNQKFCELYCGCTHSNLQSKVSFEDLQTYTTGQPGKSNQKIEQIRRQCVEDAHKALLPNGHKKS